VGKEREEQAEASRREGGPRTLHALPLALPEKEIGGRAFSLSAAVIIKWGPHSLTSSSPNSAKSGSYILKTIKIGWFWKKSNKPVRNGYKNRMGFFKTLNLVNVEKLVFYRAFFHRF
jgi:hypothetical protein